MFLKRKPLAHTHAALQASTNHSPHFTATQRTRTVRACLADFGMTTAATTAVAAQTIGTKIQSHTTINCNLLGNKTGRRKRDEARNR